MDYGGHCADDWGAEVLQESCLSCADGFASARDGGGGGVEARAGDFKTVMCKTDKTLYRKMTEMGGFYERVVVYCLIVPVFHTRTREGEPSWKTAGWEASGRARGRRAAKEVTGRGPEGPRNVENRRKRIL